MPDLSTQTFNVMAAAWGVGPALEVAGILNVSQVLSATEAGYLDGVVAGTAAASKALVLDANKDIATVRHITISGNLVTGSTTLSEAELGVLDGVTAGTATASKALVLDGSKGIATITSATITTLTNTNQIRASYTTQACISRGKVGATAGWVVGAADNLPYMATLPQNQTGSTFVMPVHGLHIGDTITGFKIIAQVESGGNTVTIDGILRAITNVAADPTDAAIGTGMTQVSVTADTAVAQEKTGLTEVVASGKSYYLLITATTGASCDIILQHPEITVTTA